MRVVFVLLLAISSGVAYKINSKSLTESMGQEVIEIGAPLKDLPPDLEEEPSAEANESDKVTSTTLHAGTPTEVRKDVTVDARRKLKDINRIDRAKEEDEEAKVERELAEMYKDNDYKADNVEVVKEDKPSTEPPTRTNATENDGTEKPIGRAKDSFKFQPDRNNPREVEWFRTSIDDIHCDKNKLAGATKVTSSGHVLVFCRIVILGSLILL